MVHRGPAARGWRHRRRSQCPRARTGGARPPCVAHGDSTSVGFEMRSSKGNVPPNLPVLLAHYLSFYRNATSNGLYTCRPTTRFAHIKSNLLCTNTCIVLCSRTRSHCSSLQTVLQDVSSVYDWVYLFMLNTPHRFRPPTEALRHLNLQ